MRSPSEYGIIIFDKVSLIRQRICNLFQGTNIHVYEASDDIVLFHLLNAEDSGIDLIIIDIGQDINHGYGIIGKIKKSHPEITIIILTSNNSRSAFIRGVAEGASDYILKPYDDKFLIEKVSQILSKKSQVPVVKISFDKEIVFDIHSYLAAEIKKAGKSNYQLSVLMSTFFIPVKDFDNVVERKYLQVSSLFYRKFKSIMWDTDLFEPYGSQTFIGVFPYCTLDNLNKVTDKLHQCFEEVKKENNIDTAFQLAISTITYPAEAPNAKDLLLALGVRMKAVIDNMKSVK